jgi:hypothetical protein
VEDIGTLEVAELGRDEEGVVVAVDAVVDVVGVELPLLDLLDLSVSCFFRMLASDSPVEAPCGCLL